MTGPRRPGNPRPGDGARVIPAVDALAYAAEVRHRLEAAPDLAGTLTAGLAAFEAIRLLARGSEDRNPGRFAAFMTAADATIDGREAQ
jgi:hypothetical protein